MGEAERDVSIGGRYLDRMEKRDGEWRIAQRTMLYDWYQDFGVSVDWSHGVMGMPFSAPHFSGRANGDSSEVFRSEEQTSELQSLMRNSYAVFGLKKKNIEEKKKQNKQRTNRERRVK